MGIWELKMNLFRHLSVVFLFALSVSAHAECSFLEVASEQQANNEFVVSGILQPKGSPTVVKLTQTIIRADTASQALDVFFNLVAKKYPEYKLATSLVSPRSSLLTYAPCKADL